jgi:hypothetical protein
MVPLTEIEIKDGKAFYRIQPALQKIEVKIKRETTVGTAAEIKPPETPTRKKIPHEFLGPPR